MRVCLHMIVTKLACELVAPLTHGKEFHRARLACELAPRGNPSRTKLTESKMPEARLNPPQKTTSKHFECTKATTHDDTHDDYAASQFPPDNATRSEEEYEEQDAEAGPSGETGRGVVEHLEAEGAPKMTPTRARMVGVTPGSTRSFGKTPTPADGAKRLDAKHSRGTSHVRR